MPRACVGGVVSLVHGCWVRLASFSPCHYCLKIEGGVVGGHALSASS